MDRSPWHRLSLVARGAAAVVAVCTVVGVPVAAVHDRAVVKADLDCRGRRWNELIARKREANRETIARACTPALIHALSSRVPRSTEERACDVAFYPPTSDPEDAAITSQCHLDKRPLPETGGFLLVSRRAWRSCAAGMPALQVCARDVWTSLAGAGLLAVVVVTRRRKG